MGFEWHGSLSATRENAHSIFYFYAFIIIIIILLIKKCIIKKKNERAEIAYLINPHKVGENSDTALAKALNTFQPAKNVEQVDKKESSSDTAIAE